MSICSQWSLPMVMLATALTASACRGDVLPDRGEGSQSKPPQGSSRGLRVSTPAGCAPDTFIARFDAPYLSTAASAAPEFQVTGLYDQRTLERLDALVREVSGDEGGVAPAGGASVGVTPPATAYSAFSSRSAQLSPELVENLRRTLVLKRKEGPVTADDMHRLSSRRFGQIELNCSIEALGQLPASTAQHRPWWHLLRTGAPPVWPVVAKKVASSRAPLIRVAVLDSGIDPAGMPEGGRVLREGEDLTQPGELSEPAWLSDTLGHGTTVANLIQETANSLVELVSIRVLDAHGRGSQADLARGLLSAVIDHRAQLLNLSLGYPRGRGAGVLPRYLVDALAIVHGAGARVYAAAGNACRGPVQSQCGAYYPAAAPWVTQELTLGVTSVSGLGFDGLASSQVIADPVDIWAPSELICARTSPAARPGAMNYRLLSGSSYAAPQVTGAVALFLALQQANLGRSLTAPELDRLQDVVLMESARDNLRSTFGVVRDSRQGGCGPGSHEGTRLNGKPGGRLNLCNIATALGVSLETCTTWDGEVAALAADYCPVEKAASISLSASWQRTDALFSCCGYANAAGYDITTAAAGLFPEPAVRTGRASAPDQQIPAVGCAGEASSLSLTPLFSLGRLCLDSPGSFQLEALLAPEASSFATWHLRLSVNGRETWFPLGDLSGYSSLTVAYQGTFAPAIDLKTVSDPWLIATDRAGQAWSGAPLMKTNCKGGSR